MHASKKHINHDSQLASNYRQTLLNFIVQRKNQIFTDRKDVEL